MISIWNIATLLSLKSFNVVLFSLVYSTVIAHREDRNRRDLLNGVFFFFTPLVNTRTYFTKARYHWEYDRHNYPMAILQKATRTIHIIQII